VLLYIPNIPLPRLPGRLVDRPGTQEGNSLGYRRGARIPAMMGQNFLNRQILEIRLIILLLNPAERTVRNRK
jgi:hypothetical protein